jgi:RNA polymerase sigma-70 factor (ECF subfamily)
LKKPHSSYTESELLVQLKKGNEAAFSQLFREYNPLVYKAAYKFLRSHTLAEEVVQDVFLKLWLKRAEIDVVRRLDAYLFVMARNFIFDRIKKMAYETAGQATLPKQEPFVDDAEYLIRQHQCQALLKEAIDLLPPQQKEVYLLSKMEGLSHLVIAARMELSPLTVKKHLTLALQAIRKHIGNNLYDLGLMIVLYIHFIL